MFDDAENAGKVCALAFDEACSGDLRPADEVVKLLPPLTITDDELDQGLAILAEATADRPAVRS